MDFELNVRYIENSLAVNSAEMKRICAAAASNNIAVSLGFSERDGDSVYIAQALITDTGAIAMKRRKMKPTHMERTVFGDASGSCLADVVNVEGVGKVGALSCWEHIQPLLKYYTFSQGEQIHVAAWPPLDGFVDGSPGFWSMSIEGQSKQSLDWCVDDVCVLTVLHFRLSRYRSGLCGRVAGLRAALHISNLAERYHGNEDRRFTVDGL